LRLGERPRNWPYGVGTPIGAVLLPLEGRAPYFATFVMGALSTTWASFSVSFFDFASAVIWSSLTSSTGATPGFQETKNSSQSGL